MCGPSAAGVFSSLSGATGLCPVAPRPPVEEGKARVPMFNAGRAGWSGTSADVSPVGRWNELCGEHWFCCWCDLDIISRLLHEAVSRLPPLAARSQPLCTLHGRQVALWNRKRIQTWANDREETEAKVSSWREDDSELAENAELPRVQHSGRGGKATSQAEVQAQWGRRTEQE